MSRFIHVTWQQLLTAAQRLFTVLGDPRSFAQGTQPSDHEEYQRFPNAAHAYIADMNSVLRYVLYPEDDLLINGNWLVSAGFQPVSSWNAFPVYRFTLPVMPEIAAFFNASGGAKCFFELAPAPDSTGWYGILRTVIGDVPEADNVNGAAAMLTSRYFRTQADVAGMLLCLGAWPFRRPWLQPDAEAAPAEE